MCDFLTITDIQHFSVHDGPGIRTTVFTKGCPLRCLWCHNPETLSRQIVLRFDEAKCVGCGACVPRCPQNAIRMEKGKAETDRSKCVNCMTCTGVCPTEARRPDGKKLSVDEITEEILRDKDYYGREGGATISGGEPLIQPEAVFALADKVKAGGVTVAVESALLVPEETVREAVKHFDYFMCDIKATPTELHEKLTGHGNGLIQSNTRILAESGKPLLLRMPLIPGLNDGEENIRATAEFILSLANVPQLEILPYHSLGMDKYNALGMEYKTKDVAIPQKEYVNAVKDKYRALGVTVKG